jgi:CAAX prenyl protease-like protein
LTPKQKATVGYVAPFLAFVSLLALDRTLHLPGAVAYPVRFAIVTLLILTVARPYLSLRPSRPLASILLGIVVFLVWIGPDKLFGEGYRHFWLFENSLMGKAQTSIADPLHDNLLFLVLRVATSVVLVPILEELFWRGWMLRWLINPNFQKVTVGAYTAMSFWAVAALFASEHGPFWEVGLVAGILYNWWLIRTKNLADCILAHAVTNGILSAYVLLTNQWQYWL